MYIHPRRQGNPHNSAFGSIVSCLQCRSDQRLYSTTRQQGSTESVTVHTVPPVLALGTLRPSKYLYLASLTNSTQTSKLPSGSNSFSQSTPKSSQPLTVFSAKLCRNGPFRLVPTFRKYCSSNSDGQLGTLIFRQPSKGPSLTFLA